MQSLVLFVVRTEGTGQASKICAHFYSLECSLNGSSIEADEFIYKNVGTGEATGLFYDYVEKSVMVRVKIWLEERLPKVCKWLASDSFKVLFIVAGHFLTTFYFYLDVAKDIFLALGYVMDVPFSDVSSLLTLEPVLI